MKPLNSIIFGAYRAFGIKTLATFWYALAIILSPFTLLAGKPGPPAPPTSYLYSIKQFNFPPGASSISPGGLDDSGRVLGSAGFPDGSSACIWEPNGQTVLLPLLPSAEVRQAGASSSSAPTGLIAGSSTIYLGSANIYYDNVRATFWENSSGVYQARDWNDLSRSGAEDVHLYNSRASSDGKYVAFRGAYRSSGTPATVIAEVLYGPNGIVTGLDVLATLQTSSLGPHDINSSITSDGTRVLRVLGDTADARYFMWKKEGNDEPIISVAPFAENPSSILGQVNGSGQVANTRRYDLNNTRALLWDETQLWTANLSDLDLGTFGGPRASARAINDHGDVVGTATTAGRTPQDRAFIYTQGKLLDLNLLAPVGKLVVQYAYRINNAGQILASGQASGNSSQTVLLTLATP